MDQPGSEETLNHLTRLGQKQGVRSYLVLSRDTGAIVRSSGFVSVADALSPTGTSNTSGDAPAEGYANGTAGEAQTAEDVARLVWNFIGAAGTMVEGLDGNDAEMKLLRVRTKKNELVIVPDTKFLLVVIHDTPPA